MRPSNILPLSSPNSARSSGSGGGGARGYASPQRVARMGTSPRNDIAPRPAPPQVPSNSSSEYATPSRHDPSAYSSSNSGGGGGSILPVLTSPAQVQVPPLRTPSPNAFKRTVWTTPRGHHDPPSASGASSSSVSYGSQTLPSRHSRSFEDDDGLPYGINDDDSNGGGGYPYYANDGDSNSYMFEPLAAERADSPSFSSSSLLQGRQQGRRVGGNDNPESKPNKYGGDDATQLAYMEQMYNTIQVLNAELEKERQDPSRLAAASSFDDEIAVELEHPQVGGGRPYAAPDYFDDPSLNLLVESTPSTASGPRRSRPLPSQQPKRPMPPPPQNKTLSKDQVELCATLGKNAELRIRTKEMEKSAEKTSEQLDTAQKQMKMVERRISNREEKLRILMKEKLHWQKELKDMRDQVVEEKMRQVELFRRLETVKREGAAQMEQLEHDLRSVHDENQNLRAQVAEARAHITFQSKKLDDVVRQARDEKEKLVSCIAETRYKFKEWKEGEAAVLRSSREQAVNNVKTEYDLKIARHQEEKQKLREKVKDLEVSLRLMQKDRTLSPLELSLRKATILGSKDNAGTSEAELIEAHSRIRELETLMEHSQEYQKRQENIIKVSEATISRLVQEREVTALENLSAQPLAGGFMSPTFSNDMGSNNMFASSIPNYAAASSPSVGAHRDGPKRQSYGNAKSSSSHDSNGSSSHGKPRAISSNRIQPASSSPLLNFQYQNETGSTAQPPSSASASVSSFSLMTSSPSKLSKASPAVESSTSCHQSEEQSEEKTFGPQRQDTGIHVKLKPRPELTSSESIREEAGVGRPMPLSAGNGVPVVQDVQDKPEDSTTATASPKPVVSAKEQLLADEVARLQRELAELKALAVSAASENTAGSTALTVSDEAEAPPVQAVSTADSVASDGCNTAVAVDKSALDGDVIAENPEEELNSDDDGKSVRETLTREEKEAPSSDFEEKTDHNEAQRQDEQPSDTTDDQGDPVSAVDEIKLHGEENSQSSEETESERPASAEVSGTKDQDAAIQGSGDDDQDSESRAPQIVEAVGDSAPDAMVNDVKDFISVPEVIASDTDSREAELLIQDTPGTQHPDEESQNSPADTSVTAISEDALTPTEPLRDADAPESIATNDPASSPLLSEVGATQEHEGSSASLNVLETEDSESGSSPSTREVEVKESSVSVGEIAAALDIIASAKSDSDAEELEPSKPIDEPAATALDESKMEVVESDRRRVEESDTKAICGDGQEQESTVVMTDENDVECSSGGGECKVVEVKPARDESLDEFKSIEGEQSAKDEKDTRQDDEEKREPIGGDADLQLQLGDDEDAKPCCENPEFVEAKDSSVPDNQAAAADEKTARSSSTHDIEDSKDLAASETNDFDDKADEKAAISPADGETESDKQPSDSAIDNGTDGKANDVVADEKDAKAQPQLIAELEISAQLADKQESGEVAAGTQKATEEADDKTVPTPAANDTEEEVKPASDRSSYEADIENSKEVLPVDVETEVLLASATVDTITPAQPATTENDVEFAAGPAEGKAEAAEDTVLSTHNEAEKVTGISNATPSDEKPADVLPDAPESVSEPELVTEAVEPEQIDDMKKINEFLPESEGSAVEVAAAISNAAAYQLPELKLEAIAADANVVSVVEKSETDESSVDGGSVPETDCDAICDPPLVHDEEGDGVCLHVEHRGDGGSTLFFNNGELFDCETKAEQPHQQDQQPTPADESPSQTLLAVGLVASNIVARVVSKGLHHSIVLHLEHRKCVAKTFVLSVLKGAIQSTVHQLVESQSSSEASSDEKQSEEFGAVEALSIESGGEESNAAQSSFAEQIEAQADVASAADEASGEQHDNHATAHESVPIADDEAPAPAEKTSFAQKARDNDATFVLPPADAQNRGSDRSEQAPISSKDQTESLASLEPPISVTEDQPVQSQTKDRDEAPTWLSGEQQSSKEAGGVVAAETTQGEATNAATAIAGLDGRVPTANDEDRDDAVGLWSLAVSTLAKNFVLAVQHEALESMRCPSVQQQSPREEPAAAETAESDGADAATATGNPDSRGFATHHEDEGDGATRFFSLEMSTFAKHFVLAVQHEAVESVMSNLCPQERIDERPEAVVDDREVLKADDTVGNALESRLPVDEAALTLSTLEPGLDAEEDSTLIQSSEHQAAPEGTNYDRPPHADISVVAHDAEHSEQPAECGATNSILAVRPGLPAESDFSAVDFVASVQADAIAAVVTSMEMEQSSTEGSQDESAKVLEERGEAAESCHAAIASASVKEDGGVATEALCELPVAASPELNQANEALVEACGAVSDGELAPNDITTASAPSEYSDTVEGEVAESCEPPVAPAEAVDASESEVIEAVDELCLTVSNVTLESTASKLPEPAATEPRTNEIRDDDELRIKTGSDETLGDELVETGPSPVAAEAEAESCLVVDVAQVSRQISLDATTAALEAYSAACTPSEATSVAAEDGPISSGDAADPVLDVFVPVVGDPDVAEATETRASSGVDTETDVEPEAALDLPANDDQVPNELGHASLDSQTEEESRLLSVNSIFNYTSLGLLNSPHGEVSNDESAIYKALEGVAVRLVVVQKSRVNTMSNVLHEDASTISAQTASEVTEATNDTSPDVVVGTPTEVVAEPEAASVASEEMEGCIKSSPEREEQLPASQTDNTDDTVDSTVGASVDEAEASPVPENSSEEVPQADAVEVNTHTRDEMSSSDAEAISTPDVDIQVVESQEAAESPASDCSETVSGSQTSMLEGVDPSRDTNTNELDSSAVGTARQIQDLLSELVEKAAAVSEDSGELDPAPAIDTESPREDAKTVDPELKDDDESSDDVPIATEAATDALNEVPTPLITSYGVTDNLTDAVVGDGEAHVTPVSSTSIAETATDPHVHTALDAILDEVERRPMTAAAVAAPTAVETEITQDRFGSRVTWSLPPEAEHERSVHTTLPKSRRTERRRTSRRLVDQSRYASMEQMRDPTLAAYDAHREQGQPFALLDDSIFSIDPHARHMQHDENDNAKYSESEIRAKRKNFEQDNHRKSIAFRSIPAFNYAPLLIRFQWSDFVIATPISVCNPITNPADKKVWNPASPVKKMRLLAKKGIKLACGSYVIISAFIRPLEDGNENLRIHIYDSEWVEEFQYDFSEDHLKACMDEWSGRDDEAKFFMTQLEFRREEDGIIIKLPDKIGSGQGGAEEDEEGDKRPTTAPAIAMSLPDGKEHPHHDHSSPQASPPHRNSRHSHRSSSSPHGSLLPIRSLPNMSNSSTKEDQYNVDGAAATDDSAV